MENRGGAVCQFLVSSSGNPSLHKSGDTYQENWFSVFFGTFFLFQGLLWLWKAYVCCQLVLTCECSTCCSSLWTAKLTPHSFQHSVQMKLKKKKKRTAKPPKPLWSCLLQPALLNMFLTVTLSTASVCMAQTSFLSDNLLTAVGAFSFVPSLPSWTVFLWLPFDFHSYFRTQLKMH